MKTLAPRNLLVACVLIATALQTSAIEGLKLTVVYPDVVLSWPSVEGETYIVQHRETLDTNSAWVTLTNSLPAEIGTNLTVFIHTNRVDCPTGQIFGMMSGSGGDPSLGGESEQDDYKPTGPVVVPKDGSKAPMPLGIYPPGLDLSGYIIIWPDGSTDEWSKDLMEKWRASRQTELDGPEPEDAGGSAGCGFYRVVRVGINWFGIADGTVLTGNVPLRLEFGNPDTNRLLAAVFLIDTNDDDNISGSTFPELPYEAANHLTGTWDTTQVTNGVYALQVGARLTDGTVYLDHPATVVVSNLMWFPDPWNVGGMGIYVGAQTAFTNGTWHLDVYDDQNIYIGSLNGSIDTDGYCNYPGIPGLGFTLDNTDGSGNQNPSTAYSMVMSAVPTGGGAPYPMATNRVFIEPAWNFATKTVVCHMNLFPNWQPGWNDVRTLMDVVWGVEEIFHPNLLGGITTPYEVFSSNDWGNVVLKLMDPAARDFFYFGHGAESALGTAGANLLVSDIKLFLKNHIDDPLTATNRHPYRFVFFDGCNTADGRWPQAFGIPKKEGMQVTDFTQKRGIRPRAFMGWNRKKAVGTGIISGGQLYPPHMQYISTFWDYWGNGGTGLHDVQKAIDRAKEVSPLAATGMKLYGAKDLVINF